VSIEEPVYLTTEELTALIALSGLRHDRVRVTLRAARLVPDPVNAWAFAEVARMRGETPPDTTDDDTQQMAPYGAESDAPDLEPLTDWLEGVLVEYDERGELFGTSGAGAYFLARHLARALAARQETP
jgi:hypothetical protein